MERHERSQWYDTLTQANVVQFADRLKRLLGGKEFTFIAVNEAFGTDAKIRVRQILEGRSIVPNSWNTHPDGSPENIGVTATSDSPTIPDWCHVLVCDSYGVWSMSNGARFCFSPETRYEPERVTITFKAGAGNEITWTVYPTGPYTPTNE